MNNNIARTLIFRLRDIFLPRIEGDIGMKVLCDALQTGKPVMFARFGAVEIKTLAYVKLPAIISQLFLKRIVYKQMPNNAGFFPCDESSLKQYYRRMIEDLSLVDFLGFWRPEEILFKNKLRQAKK